MYGILATRELDTPFHHRQLAGLRRRGTDALGFWSNADFQLAQTGLSVIGIAECGKQPIENDRHVITFNGEIYNFTEIRSPLPDHNIQLSGTSDTEVLLHAWTEFDPNPIRPGLNKPANHTPDFLDRHTTSKLNLDKSTGAACHGRRFTCLGCN